MLKVEIGKRIRDLRQCYNMSSEDLAKRLNITPGYLGLIERGDRGTTALKLIALSRIFRVSLDYLMTGNSDAPMRVPSNSLTFVRDSLNKQEQSYIVELAKELATCQYNGIELDMVFKGLSAMLKIYYQAKIKGKRRWEK